MPIRHIIGCYFRIEKITSRLTQNKTNIKRPERFLLKNQWTGVYIITASVMKELIGFMDEVIITNIFGMIYHCDR